MTLAIDRTPVGPLLRGWRERRRLSQLELSIRAEISTRHLSFVETGRARPTPEMILRLSETLDVPLRERNELLLAGGYAPAYSQRGLDEPAVAVVRTALADVLAAHAPNPALLIDRWWTLLDANDGVERLLDGVAAHLLEPPVNVCRLSLHPDGLAPRIGNLGQWRSHLIGQVRRRAERTGDARLGDLAAELDEYPGGTAPPSPGAVVLPLRLRIGEDEVALFSIAAAVETAGDVTVGELTIEAFYPADDATRRWLTAG